ncbi:hypothetical protein Hanom_Chr04g00285131 [Helianthus anomalus]
MKLGFREYTRKHPVNRPSMDGNPCVHVEILKKGVMEGALTIVCRPIISRIPCIN